ncbi:MAG: hypothetical protein ACR2GX_05715 [Candidatus Dormibacteria bacterium]
MSTPALPHRRPSGRVAAGLSLVPGLGQVYTRQLSKAVYYFAVTLVLVAGAVLVLTGGMGWGHSLIAAGSVAPALLLALGVIVVFLTLLIAGLFVWGSSAVDAWTTAREIAAGGVPSSQRRYFRL